MITITSLEKELIIQALESHINAILTRLEYAQFNGNKFNIKRYNNEIKHAKNLIRNLSK